MKNITVTVPDDVYRRARVHAAEHDTSVSSLVADYLGELTTARDAEFERVLRLQEQILDEIAHRATPFSAASRLSREELHDRDALR